MKTSADVLPDQPRPGLDPYRAPAAKESVPPSGEAALGSFATRVSLVLAGLGVVLFWGVLLLVRVLPWEQTRAELAVSWALILSVTSHLVGLGVVWAAPRERRIVGLSANGAALSATIAFIVFAFVG